MGFNVPGSMFQLVSDFDRLLEKKHLDSFDHAQDERMFHGNYWLNPFTLSVSKQAPIFFQQPVEH